MTEHTALFLRGERNEHAYASAKVLRIAGYSTMLGTALLGGGGSCNSMAAIGAAKPMREYPLHI